MPKYWVQVKCNIDDKILIEAESEEEAERVAPGAFVEWTDLEEHLEVGNIEKAKED